MKKPSSFFSPSKLPGLFFLFNLVCGLSLAQPYNELIQPTADPITIYKSWRSSKTKLKIKDLGYGPYGHYNGELSLKISDRNIGFSMEGRMRNWGALYPTGYFDYSPHFSLNSFSELSEKLPGTKGETNVAIPSNITNHNKWSARLWFNPAPQVGITLRYSVESLRDSIDYNLQGHYLRGDFFDRVTASYLGDRKQFGQKGSLQFKYGRFSNKPDFIYRFDVEQNSEVADYTAFYDVIPPNELTEFYVADNRIGIDELVLTHDFQIPRVNFYQSRWGNGNKASPYMELNFKHRTRLQDLNWRMDQSQIAIFEPAFSEKRYCTDMTQEADREIRELSVEAPLKRLFLFPEGWSFHFVPSFSRTTAQVNQNGSQTYNSSYYPRVDTSVVAGTILGRTGLGIITRYKLWNLEVYPTMVWQKSGYQPLKVVMEQAPESKFHVPVKFNTPAGKKIRLIYSSDFISPEFHQLLGYSDRINPTYVVAGNAELEYGFRHRVELKKYFPRGFRIKKSAAKKAKAYMNVTVMGEKQLNPIVPSISYDSINTAQVTFTNVLFQDEISGSISYTQRIGERTKMVLKPTYSIINYGYELDGLYQTAWNNTLDVALDINYRGEELKYSVFSDFVMVEQEYDARLGLLGSFDLFTIGSKADLLLFKQMELGLSASYNAIINASDWEDEGYTRIDFSAHWTADNQKWKFGLLCKDLLDQNQSLAAFTSVTSMQRLSGISQGRVLMLTVGLTLPDGPKYKGPKF